MPQELVTATGGEGGTFSIYFDNQRPITAKALAATITTLAKEYRAFSGGSELTVVEARQGSLKVVFQAIVVGIGIIAATNDLIQFAGHISNVLESAQHHPETLNSQQPGAHSAKSILEIAVASESRFHIEYSNAQGEHLLVDMDAPTARHLRDSAKSAARADRRAQQLALPQAAKPLLLSHSAAEEAFDDLIAERSSHPASATLEQDQALATAILFLVEALEANGASYTLDDVISRLEGRGLYGVAKLVRDARNKPRPPRVRVEE